MILERKNRSVGMYFESDVNPSPVRIFAAQRTQCKVNVWRPDDGGDPKRVCVKASLTYQSIGIFQLAHHCRLHRVTLHMTHYPLRQSPVPRM